MAPRLFQAAPVAVLILLGLVVFYRPVQHTSDMLIYMSHAQNLLLGNGYVDFDGEPYLGRGPGFAALIAAAFALLGTGYESAMWVVRVCCIASPVLVYAIGTRLFDRRVGFAAGLLVLTSFAVGFWSFRHLDAVWPLFSFGGLLALYRSLEDEKLGWAVVAGVLFAVEDLPIYLSIYLSF